MKKTAIAAMLIMTMGLSACSSQKTEETTTAETSATTVEATETSETTEATTEATTAETTPKPTPTPTPLPEPPEGCVVPEGYQFVWSDEFDGDELNTDNWFVELHRPKWVNNELQEYINSDEVIFVEDGELVIQPLKNEDENGNVTYSSGRINTYQKAAFKYGYMEARIKTPAGKGFLPAFWMLPTMGDYGGWPISGEIDIMEVEGGVEDKAYGTIHYGNPHDQNQGCYTRSSGKFSSDYHVFACEWLPGKITYYVDGEEYFSTSDWYCKSVSEKEFPAPFDTPFYIILNVAVGGDWPGDPDEDLVFDEKVQMRVDYVRVYQRETYDDIEVVKPTPRPVELSEPDSTGNYVTGDWHFYEMEGGIGKADIKDEIKIETTDPGTKDYALQLTNESFSLEEGKTYVFSFDAKADEAREMIAAITGPDHDYIRYLGDEKISLGTDYQTYEFEFTMKSTDPNARVEFNVGATNSKATITIKNVRVALK